ncbi:hypothetical protein [Sphingomonas faeni]|uniref:hypothetical protein n=1 Tax=Sphingomonas faeni TaxID=185950 RepID=UPI00335A93E5
MMSSRKIPTDAAATGRALGHESQSADKDDRYRKAWEIILDGAIWTVVHNERHKKEGKWLTYKDYALALNRSDLATASGKPWSAKTAERILVANGVTAKSLWKRVNTRKAGLIKQWPREAYVALGEASAPLDEHSPENGAWRPVIEVWPSGGAVNVSSGRFVTPEGEPRTLPDHEDEFQIKKEVSLGRFEIWILSFLERKTIQMIVPGSGMETFVWNLSREERIARHGRLRARYLREDNAIWLPNH